MSSTLDKFPLSACRLIRAVSILQSTAPEIKSLKAVPGERILEKDAEQSKRLRNISADGVAVAIIMFMMTQLFLCSRLKSATYDEQYHIANGLAYLRTGDPRLVPEHPPLINIISALPLLADTHLVLPLGDPSWEDVNSLRFSDLLLWKLNANGPSIISRARVPIMLLTLLLAVIVYAWGRQMYGTRAALLALTLLAFDPNVLAHGGLATNDAGLTCFSTLALYTFWRLLRRPAWNNATIAGFTLGLALVSKFSALFLLPALLATFLAVKYSTSTGSDGTDSLSTKRTAGYFVAILLIAFFTLWAVYGFQMGTLKGYTIPARGYLRGLQEVTHMIGGGKSSFLLGSYSDTGWWYYFPVAFAVKTPLPTLLLIGFAFFYSWRHRTWRQGLFLLIPVVIYFGFCLASPFNIGYRHLLPVLPLLFIFAGQVAGAEWMPKQTLAIGVVLVWLVVGSLAIFPHYLAYFNELVGGPGRGYKILADSNLDWGQDLIGLREYMTRENIASVKLSYAGTADPGAYGITYEPLPGCLYPELQSDSLPEILANQDGGVYAISVSNLQGLWFQNHDLYAGFRERKPDAIIGYSIYIYRLPPSKSPSSDK